MMQASLATRALFLVSPGSSALLAAFFLAGTAGLLWFGLVPVDYAASADQTTYKVIGGTIRPEATISGALGIGMLAARFLAHALMAAVAALVAMFFWQLFLLIRSTGRGDPFTRSNAGRLTRMGWFLIVPFGIVEGALFVLQGSMAPEAVLLDLMMTLMGLVFLVLAGIFRRGIALPDEAEGTV